MAARQTPSHTSVIHHIESLGLRNYSKETLVSRPVFKHEPLLKLYKDEIPALFGLLLQDNGATLQRKDPNLFDTEIDDLLRKYGSQIWPEPGQGSREHLREAQEGTRYTFDIEYPRDSTYIKEHLRKLILCKRVTSFAKENINKKSNQGQDNTVDVKKTNGKDATAGGGAAKGKTGQQMTPSTPAPAWSHGTLMLTGDAMSCDDCFDLLRQETGTECNFIIFNLPEDMSIQDPVRIVRGSGAAETSFQHVRAILQRARRFPGGLPYRTVEVEIGHEAGENRTLREEDRAPNVFL
ncbi:hypothetical protein GMOD_00006799 [Pyrenophora seminiperda CCB06]|uniref:Uncharacterized protein n=1 Tax=Pyrenophora seminiperda CCB06 TaxID=1302712 RepID=A0A3M7MBA7_9PLEO|nr:hypothetical protein GMOD_00006799 [Pyrenophora seminiperda CCB06]